MQAKSARLAELNVELNIDGRSQTQEKTEGRDAAEQESEKPKPSSILERLQQPGPRPAVIGQPRKPQSEVR